MSKRPLDLTFRKIVPESAGMARDEGIYQDDHILTDVVLSESGSLACLRKSSERADLLFFKTIGSPPEIWCSGSELRRARLCGFRADSVYAYTESELLRLEPGTITSLYATKRAIENPELSEDGRHLAWVEAGRWSAKVLNTAHPEQVSSIEVHNCSALAWIGSDELIATEIVGGDSTPEFTNISLHRVGGEPKEHLFSTAFALIKIAGDPHGRCAVLEASNPAEACAGMWSMELRAERSVEPLVAALAVGTLQVSRGICVFGSQSVPTKPGYHVIVASRNAARCVHVDEAPIDFVVTPGLDSVVYRTFGNRGSLRKIDISNLVSDWL